MAVELWSAIEIAVGLICVCLPAIRPLLVRYLPMFFGSHSERKRSLRPFLNRYMPRRFSRSNSSAQVIQVPESPRQVRVWHKEHKFGDTGFTESTQATQTTWDTVDSEIGNETQLPFESTIGQKSEEKV